jgi:protocatechuate 3,4-dioxygenase beta subunit
VVLARADHRIGLAKAVSLGIAQTMDGVDVFVERGKAIRGLVVDSSGQGLAGIRVVAGRSDPPFERPVFANSDAKGAFALEGLLPAKYRVSAWAEGGKMSPNPEFAQVTSKDVEGLRLLVASAMIVRGQVVDGTGQPVAEATIFASVERGSGDQRFVVDRTATDAQGNFELERLSPGRLTVGASHPDKGNVKWGPQDVAAAPPPLKLRLEAAASVAGTVTFEDGKAAPNVIVFAMPAQMYGGGPFFGPPPQVSTDDAGRFLLTNLTQSQYIVMARRDSDGFVGGNPRTRQTITLAAGEQKTGLQLVLPNAGKRIAGKVVGGDGRPVSGALVTASREREGYAFRMPMREGFPSSPHGVTDHEGAFVIEDLQDGSYTLWATDSSHADGERTGVAAGEASVVVKLEGGASVAGAVKTRDGKPVTDYSIAALPGGPPGQSPDDRMRLQMTARMWSPSAQVHDPSGTFFIGRLSPGAYELTVTTADGQGGLLPVTVTGGEQKQALSILIDDGVKLVGRVVDLDTNAPLEGVSVMIASATNRLNATTGKDGSFSLAGLSPGRSRVDFRLGDGETYVPEHIEIEVKPGQGTIDAGTIRKLKGSNRAKRGDFNTNGRVGFTVSLLDGKASVTGVRPGFPADKAGLKQGELVLTINGRSTEGLGNGALDYLAGGKLGERLTVTVQPRAGGAPREVTLDRVPIDYDPSRPAVAGSSAGK